MRSVWLVLAGTAMAVSAVAESGPVIEFDFSNPELTPAHWILTISPQGTGHFQSERGNAPIDKTEEFEVANIDRDISVSSKFAGRIFATVRQPKFFQEGCESHIKVAFQGWKKVTYKGPEGTESCTFNYSKDKEIEALGESLVAVAGTILEGARLEILLQHDRLGLDKETEYLVEAVSDGRVQQIGAIRDILERLEQDPEVMERVRKRAKVLLARTDG